MIPTAGQKQLEEEEEEENRARESARSGAGGGERYRPSGEELGAGWCGVVEPDLIFSGMDWGIRERIFFRRDEVGVRGDTTDQAAFWDWASHTSSPAPSHRP
ncbi:hypothetical protein GUJ93_ZPchr0004g40088 [Zizania palustris]|uniref:Uncharacterized protein n=1 Tax=Zizania palustris TaxID=103762 RepID=A0A8J5S0U9_ZIZPA|nr:hypothetical protein GUJ93_ZPchr0004g40088 [Zizania palustris]